MDARIVEHDHSGPAIALPDHRVEKFDDIGALHRRGARGVDKTVLAEVQRGGYVAPAMAVGLDTMGQTSW
ncbi:hypothetical protein OKW46_001202 [Paraburkholderia sp. WSM4179]|uniref:hypothetical protein n=1 Tax=Paraburkholderia sp. WSM4179 TaxID=2991073 RepID=UPI000369BD4A|nr:hypothetical protein [Paraburkholderia sp. WSM4179]MDH6147280.1 hypothetical protein [Paraburkholderia sp. WSM4179]